MSQRRCGDGFTLIELLVVISIIGIIAAILFPVISRARESGRRTQCISNLRQISIASQLYQEDFDSDVVQTYVQGQSWIFLIYPYLKSLDVYQCPDDPYANGGRPPVLGDGSYGLQAAYCGAPQSSPKYRQYLQIQSPGCGFQTTPESVVQTPDSTVEFLDTSAEIDGSAWYCPANDLWTSSADPADVSYGTGTDMGYTVWFNGIYAPHDNRINVAYYDGHVKSSSLTSLVQTEPLDGFSHVAYNFSRFEH